MDPDWFELPVFYFQNPAAVGGARDDVAIAPGAQRFDYELEFAAVIGPGGSDLAPDVAEPFRAAKRSPCGSPLPSTACRIAVATQPTCTGRSGR